MSLKLASSRSPASQPLVSAGASASRSPKWVPRSMGGLSLKQISRDWWEVFLYGLPLDQVLLQRGEALAPQLRPKEAGSRKKGGSLVGPLVVGVWYCSAPFACFCVEFCELFL